MAILGSNSARSLLGCAAAAAALVLYPCVVPVYWTMILTEVLIMALFAMSFNLLFGYSGLLSFGQAGFFGVGAYAAALCLTHGVSSLAVALLSSVLAAALVSAVIGYFCVRRDEIFFAMLTLGFGMMLFTVAHNWRELTGGSDGLPLFDIPPLALPGLSLSLFPPRNMYFFALGTAALGAWVLRRVVRSPFGLTLAAVRENKDRLAFVGADVRRVRLMAFILAGSLAGLAGGTFCLFNRMATPDFMHWAFSAKPVMMTILGGSGVFWGPAFGAAVFFLLEQLVTNLTDNWMIVLGAVLIPVVIFFPKGILGTAVDPVRMRKGADR